MKSTIHDRLSDLPLGEVRYFDQIDSTNEEAKRWLEQETPTRALVVADEQTAGRGRSGRRWFTPKNSALAFSLILSDFSKDATPTPAWATSLGALAVCQAMEDLYNLPATIKWPNDVLVFDRKICGILSEAFWVGDSLEAIILGLGINVAPASIPEQTDPLLPAACIDDCLSMQQPSKTISADRWQILHAVLSYILSWQERLSASELMHAWENRLAYRDKWVQAYTEVNAAGVLTDKKTKEGKVMGLAIDGSLILIDGLGSIFHLKSGEIRLRPVEENQ
ncbi:MAG: biotin--[acetyl-CoA-carboxylase] ligase [Anaerolineales bacterium]|nr:biotin--[acetyl-CoA-carboxylase] ligase [Anaerolineales bacterium]